MENMKKKNFSVSNLSKNIFSPIKVLSTTSYYLTDEGHYTEFLGSNYVLF